ncbi:hypothetical protein D3C80_1502410 [compost metagenome]
MAVHGRRLAVHAELEAALDALGVAVDPIVLLPIGRIHGIGTPQRRGIGLATLIEVAVGAVHAVADVFRRLVAGIDEDRPTILHQLAKGVGRQVLLLRRLEHARCGSRCRNRLHLRLILHRDLGGLDRCHDGQGEECWHQDFHCAAPWGFRLAK